jgi:peroxiredoxin Q/BCP
MPKLVVGSPAPDFTLPAADGTSVTLSELRRDHGRSVVVYFYPAAMTPGCSVQARDFRDAADVFTGHEYVVLGVSPDPVTKLAEFAAAERLSFPLLSDPDHIVMTEWGAWGEKSLYGRRSVGVIRSTVVVGPDGVVRLARYNVKATGHVALLRKALDLA